MIGALLKTAQALSSAITAYLIYKSQDKISIGTVFKGLLATLLNYKIHYYGPGITLELSQLLHDSYFGPPPSAFWHPFDRLEYDNNKAVFFDYMNDYRSSIILPLGMYFSYKVVDFTGNQCLKLYEHCRGQEPDIQEENEVPSKPKKGKAKKKK